MKLAAEPEVVKLTWTKWWLPFCFLLCAVWCDEGVWWFLQGKNTTREKPAEERTLSHRQDENRHSTRSQVQWVSQETCSCYLLVCIKNSTQCQIKANMLTKKYVMPLGIMTFPFLPTEVNPGECYLGPFLCLFHHKAERVCLCMWKAICISGLQVPFQPCCLRDQNEILQPEA